MGKNNDEDIKKISIDFLIRCYFGQSKDLLRAAIDRAYVDMAAHTLKGFDDESYKWECRYNTSLIISECIKEYPGNFGSFDEWHQDLIVKIKENYTNPQLSDGQAQKWLNMTIKYLFVFKQLLVEYPDYELPKSFLDRTCIDDYKIPIDSNILKSIGITESWSSMDYEKYKNVNEQLALQGKDFNWELFHWIETTEEYKVFDKKSYAYFYNEKSKDCSK